MDRSLRTQALERMQQLYGVSPAPSAAPAAPESAVHDSGPLSPEADKTGTQTPLLAFLKGLGLDRDRLILLLTLVVLYYDHASPKILLAVLYLML